MEGLLGVVLVVKFPSQQPHIAFQYPQRGVSHESNDIEKSTTDMRVSPKSKTPEVGDFPQPSQKECFGIPFQIFATLMIPGKELCDRPFYLEMDAGQFETSHRHDPQEESHLLFVSFPTSCDDPPSWSSCTPTLGADDIPWMSLGDGSGTLTTDIQENFSESHRNIRQRVQFFNVVHVLDLRRTCRHHPYVATLWQAVGHLSAALLYEERRVGYISWETEEVADSDSLSCDDCRETGGGLFGLLINMYEGLMKDGYTSLYVNHYIFCRVSIFPKSMTPSPPSACQAIALKVPRDKLLEELPRDGAECVRRVILAAAPNVSLNDLMVSIELPLRSLQCIAQHLVFWNKAKIVDIFHPQVRVALNPSVVTSCSDKEQRFNNWRREVFGRPKKRGYGNQTPSYFDVVNAFAAGKTLEKVRQEFTHGHIEFQSVFEWVVAEDIIVQLAKFCRFTPLLAQEDQGIEGIGHVHPQIREQFSPQLTEYELQLLLSRSQDNHVHDFLCRFVVEFLKKRRRIDGWMFAEFMQKCPHTLSEAWINEECAFISDNEDIFVTYTCYVD